MKFSQEHGEIRRTMTRFDPRDTRNVLGFALSICGDDRTVRHMQFGVARP